MALRLGSPARRVTDTVDDVAAGDTDAHVLVSAGGPYYAPLADMDVAGACRYLAAHVGLTLRVARCAARIVRPGGTLLFMGGTGARKPAVGISITALLTAGVPALIANLALELAPIRVNLIAAGFVDTPSRPRCLATTLMRAASNCVRRFRSDGWWGHTTSPCSLCSS